MEAVSALIVSSYEFVRAGNKAFLLKMNGPSVAVITERESLGDAIATYMARPHQLIFIDDTILTPENLPEVKRLTMTANSSLVLCLLLRSNANHFTLAKQAGVKGCFFASIPPAAFVNCIEELIATGRTERDGFVWM